MINAKKYNFVEKKKSKINEFYRTHSEQRCTDTLVFGVFKC